MTAPHPNRLSDAAFVALLGVTGLAVALIPVPGWLRMVGFDVLLAVASGVTLYLVLKYATGVTYLLHGRGVQPAAVQPRDGLALGSTLLVLAWAGRSSLYSATSPSVSAEISPAQAFRRPRGFSCWSTFMERHRELPAAMLLSTSSSSRGGYRRRASPTTSAWR